MRFVGGNGKTYRLDNVSGSTSTFTAVVYDPDYGYVDLSVSNATSCVTEGGSYELQSGSIVMTDSAGIELRVTVNSCGDYSSSIIDPSLLR
jgi:hypothetical protein